MSLQERLSLTSKPVYLIDGSAFIFRAFYAMQHLKRADGFPTNALFIVSRILMKMLRDESPEHIAFVLDGRGKNFRHELYGEYKANRSATPEDLVLQLEPIKAMVKHLGIHLIVSDGCEADDCIAALAGRLKKDHPVVIVGADKDLKQCLDTNVFLWDPGTKQEKLTTLEDFIEETNLTPAQWADYQAIIGDSSDNIPGVPGIGPKTADKIFAQFKTLEEIRDGFDELKPNLQKKFADHLDNMFVFRQLTKLNTDTCDSEKLEDFKLKPISRDIVLDFVKEYELRALVREVNALSHADEPAPEPKKKKVTTDQLGLFGGGEKTIPDEPDARPAMSVSDVTGLTSCKDKRVAVLLAEQTESNSVLVAIEQAEFLYAGKMDELADFCADAKQIITPDAKALFRQHAGWSSVDPNKLLDLGLMAYLLNPEDRDYSWKKLSRKADELEISRKNGGLLALAIAEELERSLDGGHLRPLMLDIELPLVGVLANMEEAGIRIDREAFAEFLKEVQADLDNLTRSIYDIAGKPFNIRSAQQLGKILFDDLGLASKTKTSGGQASTSQAVLEKLAGEHEIIDLILEYRKLEKLRSTYLEPLPKLVDENDRIHTTFNQLATATGRLSSSNPNLQNIPARGEFGTRMRSCFVAAEGKKLVSADYSQVELRVLAHCSQDPTLLEAFKQDRDIHSSTAALLFDSTVEDVTSDQRRNAKTINFGLIYGMGPQKLAGELKITLTEAKEFIRRYFEKLQHLKEFYDKVEEDAKLHGYVATLAGRRRYLPEITSGNNMMQSQARRQAINTVIQGSAADIIKIAMIKTAEDLQLKQLKAQLILQIHDELVLEVPTENAEAAASRLQEIMSNIAPDGKNLMDVPLKVDAGIGDRWNEAH
ncbi:DNA polymerase I [Halodesulfovibrio aestuarii]|uniref:DNA polymerase I n=1 Tax=Halodesulfovibrio aestuarii TaxID=126333 RepID=UPI0003F74EC7